MNRISIVTINYNNAIGLLETIRTVRKQRELGADFEYVVIDGKSTDDSQQVIENNKDIIDILICEKDTGIYNAMNKGLNVSSGVSIVFLNSGDTFFKDFNLKEFQETYDLSKFNVFSKTIQHFENVGFIRPKKIENATVNEFGHQGCFILRDIYKMLRYDETKKIEADSIWLKQAWEKGPNIKVENITSVFELGGISNNYTFSNTKKLLKEKKSGITRVKILIKFSLQSLFPQKLFYLIIYGKKYSLIRDFKNE